VETQELASSQEALRCHYNFAVMVAAYPHCELVKLMERALRDEQQGIVIEIERIGRDRKGIVSGRVIRAIPRKHQNFFSLNSLSPFLHVRSRYDSDCPTNQPL
jgi:hypothetical protein